MASEKTIQKNSEIFTQHYEKLLEQTQRVTFTEEKAVDAVGDTWIKISQGKIDLTGVKHPYSFLVKCCQNTARDNHRKTQAKKRNFNVENLRLVGDSTVAAGLAEAEEVKRKSGLWQERPDQKAYEGDSGDDW